MAEHSADRCRTLTTERRTFLRGVVSGGVLMTASVGAPPARAAAPTPTAPDPAIAGALEETALEAPPPPLMTTEHVGSDFMIDVIKSLEIEYIAANPGSSFRGLHESLINYGGNVSPRLLTCLHEETSVAIAVGYARATGEPIGVFVHSTVGLQHASMSIYHAFADRSPVVIFCGNTMNAANRRAYVEWVHAAQDNAAMVRDCLKWDDQPVSLAHFAESTVRAYRLATSAPMGPVMLTIDSDLQEEPLHQKPDVPSLSPRTHPVAATSALEKVAESLLNAQFPVILADRYARTEAGMPQLVALAELVGAAVVDRGARMNFPNTHPLSHGERGRQVISRADFVLALEPVDLWGALNTLRDQLVRTSKSIAPEGQTVAVIGLGEMLTRSNYQDFQRYVGVGLSISGDAEASLPDLMRIVTARMTSAQREKARARAAKLADEHRAFRESSLKAARIGWDASPISTARLCSELWEVIKEEDWVLCGATNSISNWPLRTWDIDKPYQLVRGGGAAAIGTGIGIAVGLALGHRDKGRIVVNIQTDGDLLYAPGALWTASHEGIPILNVMHNNRAYHQETMHIQRMANRLERGIDRAHIGTVIDDPPVDFVSIARGLGVWAEGPIDRPADLPGALRRALDIVKSGKPALVDVLTQVR